MNSNEKDKRVLDQILRNYELEMMMVREIERKRMAPKRSNNSNGSRKKKLTEVL